MALGSLLLGVLSLLMMIAGFFFTPVRYVGAAFSFGAPVMALVGIVMAGLAMSRAKQAGEPSGLAVAGLVLNIVGFILGGVVALTCGLCNMACSQHPGRFRVADGGASFRGQLGAEMARLPLSRSLRSMAQSCATDPTGAANAAHFHPSVAASLQGKSCEVDATVADAYGRSCASGQHPCADAARVAPSSPEAEAARAAGLDPASCFVYRSGDGKIVLCNEAGRSYIVQWENVAAID